MRRSKVIRVRIGSICLWLAGVLASGVVAVLFGLGERGPQFWVALSAMPLFYTLAWWLKGRGGVYVEMYAPVALDNQQAQRLYAKHGLIVLVGLYRPHQGSRAQGLSPQQHLDYARRCDYQPLDLPKSTLGTAIAAVKAHSTRLEHCWFVTTTSLGNQPSALDFIPVLEKYLKDQVSSKCQYHYGPNYAITFRENDLSVSEMTRSLVNGIFDEARKEHQIGSLEIVCDYTSCPRSMALGMILACLAKDRDVQFVGARYDDQGRPVGDLFPILYRFSPVVEKE